MPASGLLSKTIKMFLLSILIMILMIMVFLGFMLGLSHPLPWIIIFILIAIPVVHDKLLKKYALVWHSSMSTGIPMIDKDHKRLIRLINKFQEATEYNVPDTVLQNALDEVVKYTQYHFDREEKLMAINNYPGFLAHQRQHKKMINKIDRYVHEYRVDNTRAINHILEFLQAWIVLHIKGCDLEYVPYLKIKSIPEEPNRNSEYV